MLLDHKLVAEARNLATGARLELRNTEKRTNSHPSTTALTQCPNPIVKKTQTSIQIHQNRQLHLIFHTIKHTNPNKNA